MRNRIAKGFDFLAPVYDALARWTTGNDIVYSQLCFIKKLNRCHRILILGGGSGWILESLCHEIPDLEVDYIELSPKMMEKAVTRVNKCGRVHFITGTEQDIPTKMYDGVITNFYLDMFEEQTLINVIEKVKSVLVNHSVWIATDFVNEHKCHSIRLWGMYRFFGAITHIEAKRLSDWRSLMASAGFQLMESMKFANGFIVANCYKMEKAATLNTL